MADETDDSANFLSRWSRRKRARSGARQDSSDAPRNKRGLAEVETGRGVATLPETAGDVVPADGKASSPPEPLPDPETLTMESDFTAYLRENVPAPVRQAALRRLWRLDPVFANLDGLNEYDLDYRAIHSAVKNVISSYQVGKGMPGRPIEAEEAPNVEPEHKPEPAQPPHSEEPESLSAAPDEEPSSAIEPANGPDMIDAVDAGGSSPVIAQAGDVAVARPSPRRRRALAVRQGLPGGE